MTKAKILIVEDEAVVAEDLSRKLERLGYEIVGVTGRGAEAVELAREHRLDLVLMDIRLQGGMNGVEAAQAIQREGAVPVIYLTAHSDPATLERAKVTEPFGYILKPFDVVQLETHIQMALYKHRAEEQLRQSNATYAAINQVLHAGLTAATEQTLARVCLEVAEKITQSKFGFIGEIRTDGLQDVTSSSPALIGANVLDAAGQPVVPRELKIHGIYGRVLKDGNALFTNDPAQPPDGAGLPAGHPPLQSFLGAPLRFDGTVAGMIAVANREGGYTQAQQESLEALLPAVVEAFLRKRAEAALRASNKEMEAFNRLMIGRELRMIELKKEVDELCRRFGEPSRYGYKVPPAKVAEPPPGLP
jgi:CheY-like chemotaxis protein